jgi:T4 RnlA family RNA ligase
MKQETNMIALQKFLQENSDWVEKLRKNPYNLMIQGRDDLILFKYVQFASDFSLDLVKESRGIILNRNTFKVVCRPFDKFFNFGEPEAHPIKFSNSYIMEKIDGSLIKVYWYDGWKIATNGTIDSSDATTNDEKMTFEDLFFDIISKEDFKKLSKKLNPAFTYLFELIHPLARIIVNYGDKKELVFTGIRHNEMGFDYNIFSDTIKKLIGTAFFGLPIRFPKIFKIDNVKDMSELSVIADEINTDGTDFEGFVVAEIEKSLVRGRVKIKSPKYIKFHRLTGGQGVRTNIVQLLIDGERDEFEAYLAQLPDYIKTDYEELKEKYDKLVSRLKVLGAEYKKLSEENDRKTVALTIQDKVERQLQGFVFSHVYKNVSLVDYIQLMGTKNIKQILENIK